MRGHTRANVDEFFIERGIIEESGDIENLNNNTSGNVRNFRLTMTSNSMQQKDVLEELEEKAEHKTTYDKMKFQITNLLIRMNKNYMGTTHLYERTWTLPIYFPKGTDLLNIAEEHDLGIHYEDLFTGKNTYNPADFSLVETETTDLIDLEFDWVISSNRCILLKPAKNGYEKNVQLINQIGYQKIKSCLQKSVPNAIIGDRFCSPFCISDLLVMVFSLMFIGEVCFQFLYFKSFEFYDLLVYGVQFFLGSALFGAANYPYKTTNPCFSVSICAMLGESKVSFRIFQYGWVLSGICSTYSGCLFFLLEPSESYPVIKHVYFAVVIIQLISSVLAVSTIANSDFKLHIVNANIYLLCYLVLDVLVVIYINLSVKHITSQLTMVSFFFFVIGAICGLSFAIGTYYKYYSLAARMEWIGTFFLVCMFYSLLIHKPYTWAENDVENHMTF